ncbi:N-acetylgalactosaminyltransferase 7-like [Pecten maximus]|uniref:N-acetylgalactosaminyltransferase 7-like n=1 Tax=Pecten maximus TaxID=6579 RepID=UPI001457F829|nr:N-acetylgalactosaminyltransferase 7-like [Pecten maximus]
MRVLRYRRGAIIKLGIVTLIALIIVPFFFLKLDGSKDSKSKKDNLAKDSHPLQKGPRAPDAANGPGDVVGAGDAPKNVVDNPVESNNGQEEVQMEVPNKFGPPQRLTPGQLGNFEPRDYPSRNGPGENGQAVYTKMEERTRADATTREFGFNMVNSDKIAMDRTIPDTRLDECKYWQYPEDLPTASVILVFHNEGWSTLMRTVHSIINMSPAHLLKEVVMVDDYSTKDHLKGKLEEYIKQFNGKVKLYRNSERLGLIGTRTRGAELSTGDVIVFLDAHCECNRNWLPPLLARIRYDRTIMAVPIVDGVDWDNFRYHPVYGEAHHRGIFEWGFLYKESTVPQKELSRRQHNSEPYRSPTHAGGLFAMDRKYFFEMGAYDEGLKIWGGENFELSFKIWQCGGSIEWVPCSRVGHVYRNHMPYGFGKLDVKIPVISLNYMRVVEVWLDDEHKEFFYTREPSVRGYPVGDLTKQLKFKKDHKCKSFKWFMEEVAYEVYDRFPKLPPNKAWGEVKEKNGMRCLDTMGQQVGGGAMGISGCHHFGGNQMFRINTKGQMGVGERCIEAPNGSTLHMHFCETQPTGPWQLDLTTGVIRHEHHQKCLEAGSGNKVTLEPCDPSNDKQKWVVNEIRQWK